MAAVCAYLSTVWAGAENPLWPHLLLVPGAAIAGFAVGIGILLERPKFSAKVHRVAFWMVLSGVTVETLFTVTLFVVDERISGAQSAELKEAKVQLGEAIKTAATANNRAAILEKEAATLRARAIVAEAALEKLKTPRTLGPTRQDAVADAVKSHAGQRYDASISQGADDGVARWESIYTTLQKAGWVFVSPGPNAITVGNPGAGIPIAAIPGIEILFNPVEESQLMPRALALGNALHADGTIVAVNRDPTLHLPDNERDIIQIRIGARVPRE